MGDPEILCTPYEKTYSAVSEASINVDVVSEACAVSAFIILPASY
jgi:uncharacterized protein with FMN-binding domain